MGAGAVVADGLGAAEGKEEGAEGQGVIVRALLVA